MPKYNYKCLACGCVFDVEATIKEREDGNNKFACPKCQTKKTMPQFSSASFIKNIFSGSNKGCGCGPGGKGENKKDGCCG